MTVPSESIVERWVQPVIGIIGIEKIVLSISAKSIELDAESDEIDDGSSKEKTPVSIGNFEHGNFVQLVGSEHISWNHQVRKDMLNI